MLTHAALATMLSRVKYPTLASTSITGQFSDAYLRHLGQAFPVLLKQLELMLVSVELNPRHRHCITLYAKGLTCDADSLGSHGYVYLAIYPTPSETQPGN
jgi:cytoskeleton bundling-enhancing protein CbeA-like protein